MKDERFDDLAQIGYALFVSLFCIFILAGLLLDSELLQWISMIFFLYIPFMICAITIRYAGQDWKRKKRKRERERRLRESDILQCRSCDRIYKRDELDISSTSFPRCPTCNNKLVSAV